MQHQPTTKTPPALASVGRISSYCTGGNCVTMTSLGADVVIGDSKSPEGPVLRYSREEFAAFVNGVKAGEFDDLC